MAIKKLIKAFILKKGYNMARRHLIPMAKKEWKKRRRR